MISFPLNVEKAIEAIGVLFRRDGVKQMNYMRVLKLLYIADREAIQETCRAITGGRTVAMERGPVLEDVYDLIHGRHEDMPLWDRFFKKNRYSLELIDDPDVEKLSKYEIAKLQEISEKYEDEDEWSLSRKTQEFPEWKRQACESSTCPILLTDILEAVGLSDSAEQIVQEVSHLIKVQRELGGNKRASRHHVPAS